MVPADQGIGGYQTLMARRVEQVLLVASPYDCFILEEDGRFSDRIFSQYLELNLSYSPRFNQVSSARQALAELRKRPHDLVITTHHCAGMSPRKLAATIKERYPDLPVVMLTYDAVTARQYSQMDAESGIDQVFLWTGEPRLLLALVKSVEDRLNVDRDARKGNVRVILLVEDSPEFYSSYLPILYQEVLEQTQSLMSDVLNHHHRFYRMRARPKILHARNFEEARALLRKYKKYLLGVVMDVRFPRRGVLDGKAGLQLYRLMRESLPDTPVLFQSAEQEHAQMARELGTAFADKNSPELLAELRSFMSAYLGFGSFIFRVPDGRAVDEAADMHEMIECLHRVPEESVRFHAERNHFSNWLMARSEFGLANEVRPRRVSDFQTTSELRDYLVAVFGAFLERRQRGQITDFVRGADPLQRDFARVGGGSMGGKARGIAFLSQQLAGHDIHRKYPDIHILVPRTVVVCTDVFDRFVTKHNLREQAMECKNDEAIARLFLAHPLDDELMADLASILAEVHYPTAVRSSSLLEDSAFQPFAGLYRTLMLPNCSPSARTRLEQLTRAVRLVFASTFFEGPRAYMDVTALRLEEQMMAVILQRLIGRSHAGRFYPDFAGVAQSHNFYPVRYLLPEDGIATVALGLGQTVVEGGKALRFCPRHPEVLPQMSSVADALRYSQNEFYALDMEMCDRRIDADELATLRRFGLDVAEADGTLEPVGATWSMADERIRDTIHSDGMRIVNFSQILRYGRFPLGPILFDLLEMGAEGLGAPVEMEFACSLEGPQGQSELAVVQIRPLVADSLLAESEVEQLQPDEQVVVQGPALGHGTIKELFDIVLVDPEHFDPSRTRAVAKVIERLNTSLLRQRRTYLLAAPGRWGTSDPWLGIPVQWSQVSAARVMVELAVPGFRIDPSQGTHFFHNITSLRVGYFTIDLARGDDIFDLAWMRTLKKVEVEDGVTHIRLQRPLEARIDGRTGHGVVVRRRSIRKQGAADSD